jgi:hypothetical protein
LTSSRRATKAKGALSTTSHRLLIDEQKEKKRANEKQCRRDRAVSKKLQKDDIASLTAKNARLTNALSKLEQNAPEIDDFEGESSQPLPVPEPEGAAQSTGTESEDGGDGEDEINDGTYVGSPGEEIDAIVLLEKLRLARCADKWMRRWTGLAVAVFDVC